ncbi:MAG: hypothetical protein JSS69_17450, partial [Acidobacteria bacterium]|nr:hypothetical protein [Acidobacteriota bacterium]
EWFEHPRLQIEVSQIIIHKADQPDVVVHFFDARGLPGEDRAEIDFPATQANAATTGEHDGSVVEKGSRLKTSINFSTAAIESKKFTTTNSSSPFALRRKT